MDERSPSLASTPGSIVSQWRDVLCPDVVLQLRPLERASPGVIAAIIASFVETQDEFVRTADAALAAADLESVRRGAHKLKGAAGSLGALRLSAAAQALEVAAAAADLATAGVALRRVIAEYQAASAALVAAFAPESPT
jgi:HPt (histidine-containing phosphotransfer) domain-containing protein